MAENTNPQSMTDEELDKVLGEEPVVEADVPVEPEEPKEKSEEEPEVEEELEEELEEEPVEEPKPASRREQLRIQDVLSKLKDNKPTPKAVANPDALNYEEMLDADPELINKLKADRDATNQAMYTQGIEQAKSIQFHTRLEIDAPRVEAKYPQLDKESQDFNPMLADAVNQMFLSTAGYNSETDTVQNPGIRYATYVESIFELANEIAGEKTEATRTNIKKQAAKTGLRPDGSGAKKMNLSKSPETMTDEELDAVIALGIPKR